MPRRKSFMMSFLGSGLILSFLKKNRNQNNQGAIAAIPTIVRDGISI